MNMNVGIQEHLARRVSYLSIVCKDVKLSKLHKIKSFLLHVVKANALTQLLDDRHLNHHNRSLARECRNVSGK